MGRKAKNFVQKEKTLPPVSRPGGRSKKRMNSEDIVEVADSDSGGKESTKDRSNVIPWAENPAWLGRAIEHLTTDSSFHLKLFSDSTEDANKEDRIRPSDNFIMVIEEGHHDTTSSVDHHPSRYPSPLSDGLHRCTVSEMTEAK
jgi:hypothetical protein